MDIREKIGVHLVVKNPAHRAGLLLKKKPHGIGSSRPQTLVLAIHPRAQHGAFWLFHVNGISRK